MDIEEGREERDISHPYHYYPFLFSACGRSYRGRMRSALRQGAGEESPTVPSVPLIISMASTPAWKAPEIFSPFSDKASRRFAPKCSRIVSFLTGEEGGVANALPAGRARNPLVDRYRGFNAVSFPRSNFHLFPASQSVHFSKFFFILIFTRSRKREKRSKLLREDLLARLNAKETSLVDI